MNPAAADIIADFTYVRRRDSGMERVARTLFSPTALHPLNLEQVWAGAGTLPILVAQLFRLPALARRNTEKTFLFTGYPPSLFFPLNKVACALYVHDIFLLTRPAPLNLAARLYLAPQFRRAIRKMRLFLCNSQNTADQLREVCAPDATVLVFRPAVENLFALTDAGRDDRPARPDVLKIVSLGTVEPRKNYSAAVAICRALSRLTGLPVHYDIIGRKGWAGQWEAISAAQDVTLHGYLDAGQIKKIVESADMVLSTSVAEGLGLPMLELQYAGMPVIAPDGPVFREVLGSSGLHIDTANPDSAASAIAGMLLDGEWRTLAATAARQNIARWNAMAHDDRAGVVTHLLSLRQDREVDPC